MTSTAESALPTSVRHYCPIHGEVACPARFSGTACVPVCPVCGMALNTITTYEPKEPAA